MSSIKVINKSGNSTVTGRLVKTNPNQKNSFTLLGRDDKAMLGITLQSGISDGMYCSVQVDGTANLYINGVCKVNDIIRSLTSSDSGPAGTGMVVKSSDVSYLKVGIALESGSNKLILIQISPEYILSVIKKELTPSQNIVSSGSYTIKGEAGITSLYVTATTDTDVYLPPAKGTGMKIEISNVGTGICTVHAHTNDTIAKETYQEVYEDDCMVVKDYTFHKWIID